ncbi:hypothetical protein JLDGIFFK_00043 [Klebsiella phage vB_KppS-Samwise]|uniref:DUF7274 domain-containing protein n=1 Tax=Klebsiella phage vB_KppS-Samwise TaxID=2762815 RepID=A0A7R8R5P8_9CAUD|nr:hypothetical protein OBHDAGOG_00071 [Klebsiella phage vB_KaS-Ahsoka]CAD5239679.1 hypothetical protein JLDGIFFK_00043 [Klebsiella phage vB_KppS-Samwise]CAD5239772.1 hypothetical protein EONHMLJF_00043 [Klebsiella phage vB_KaS-Gatomon]CAJ1038937.1 hypothetical protein SAMARA_00043 [Klebsiella phage vB_KppS-Samwise]CAJ1039064.1 hypothetical protein LLOFRUDD_00083 [Klebsiella phage vB_KppS-Samwise]
MIEIKFDGKSKKFNGVQIHKDATHAVAGRNFGTYFKLNGEWYFTVFTCHALKCTVAGQDFDIRNHIKDDAEITELK